MKLPAALLLPLLSCALAAQLQTGSQGPASNKQDGSKQTESSAAPKAEEVKIDPGKEADIRQLLDLTKVSAMVTQLMGGMEQGIKPLMTSALPAGEYREKLVDLFFVKFHSKIESSNFVDLVVPVYAKYYTREEIESLIQFYKTPLGQKMVATMPKLTADLQAEGRKWGQQLGSDSMSEVLLEHPELEKALEDAKNPFPK